MRHKEPLLKLREVATILNVSYNTLRTRIDEEDELSNRVMKIGPDAKSWRIAPKDLEDYLKRTIDKKEAPLCPSTKEVKPGTFNSISGAGDLDHLLAEARQRHKQKNLRLN